jgi:hypothetical protein
MVMAVAAMFVALGGSAYAATKIGTKQIQNNAITASKIKKNAVTAAKIKNGAVTGSKINLSTLGTVPSATHATTADTATKATSADTATKAAEATTAGTADTATNFSRYFASGLKKASVGQTIALTTVGPFTFSGVCADNGGENYAAHVVASTNVAGAYFNSPEEGSVNGAFEPGEELAVQEFFAESTAPEWMPEDAFSYYNEFTAASPDGSVLLQGQAESGVHVFGADCAFELHGTNTRKQ